LSTSFNRPGLEPELIEKISKMRVGPAPPIKDPLFNLAVEKQTVFESYEEFETGRVLTLYQPLKNLKECQECHNRDHSVRGVLRISLGLDRLDAELREARNWQLAIALLTIFGVALTIIAFMSRVVLHPIAKLMAIAKRIGAGDFSVRINMRSQDEIGQLGGAINEDGRPLEKGLWRTRVRDFRTQECASGRYAQSRADQSPSLNSSRSLTR
jgi:methyl-accepting chemotaxis protein